MINVSIDSIYFLFGDTLSTVKLAFILFKILSVFSKLV